MDEEIPPLSDESYGDNLVDIEYNLDEQYWNENISSDIHAEFTSKKADTECQGKNWPFEYTYFS